VRKARDMKSNEKTRKRMKRKASIRKVGKSGIK